MREHPARALGRTLAKVMIRIAAIIALGWWLSRVFPVISWASHTAVVFVLMMEFWPATKGHREGARDAD